MNTSSIPNQGNYRKCLESPYISTAIRNDALALLLEKYSNIAPIGIILIANLPKRTNCNRINFKMEKIMCIENAKKLFTVALTITALSATPTLAAPISPQEIIAIYSGSSIVSDGGTQVNYYAPDGSIKSTTIKTGESWTGKWYVTNASKICVVTKNKSCWKATQTKTEVCFSQKNKKICRTKNAYMRGDQTSAYVKK